MGHGDHWRHPDAPALAMLGAILTGGRSTTLYRRLVTEEQKAVQVSAYQGPGFAHPRLFTVAAIPRAPHTTEELEAVIYEEIEKVKATPPSPEALERVKNQIRAGEYRRLSSNFGLASQLADSKATFGDWRTTFRLGQRILDVTPEDVQRVAQQYLIDRTRTVATLVRGETR